MKKTLFISHATEDQEEIAHPLAEALSDEFQVWYAKHQLVVGMSLLEEISKGLADCDYGVVILSPHFFAKKWTQQELNGLFTLEEKDRKVILPVWHNIDQEEVKKHSPILADRVAAISGEGVESVVAEIKRSITYFDRGKIIQNASSSITKLRETLHRKEEIERSDRIVSSPNGVTKAFEIADATIQLFVSHIEILREEELTGIRIDGPKKNNVSRSVSVWIGDLGVKVEYFNNIINTAHESRLNILLILREPGSWGERKLRIVREKNYALFVDVKDQCMWKRAGSTELYSPKDIVDYWITVLSDELSRGIS